MSCDGRWAESWQFAAFFCSSALLSRVHDGAGNAGALSDSQASFINAGVRANVGMILYNLTDGSSGPVTAVTLNTITATLAGGVENDWDAGDVYRIVTIDAQEIARAQHWLDITASDLHAALAAQGMCDCTLSGWGAGLLAKLNIIEAASFYTCGCMAKLTTEEKEQYREWTKDQLMLIRTGKVDVCQGATGAEYPAFGSVKEAITDFAQAQIIADRIAKQSN